MRTSVTKKYKRISTHFIQHKGYLGPLSPLFSERSLYPFILGIRDNYYYFNLVQCFSPIKSGLNVLENLIISHRKIIFLDSNKSSHVLNKKNSLTCLENFFLPKSLNLSVLHYNYRSVQQLKNKDIGFFIIQNADKSIVLESEGKTAPILGVGCSSLYNISYPFNVNIDNMDLANWYLYVLFGLFRRSLYKRKKNEI